MSFVTRGGRHVDDATISAWTEEAEAGYRPDQLTPTDERFLPTDGDVNLAIRLPVPVYQALYGKAVDTGQTRDELITEAVQRLLAA